MAVRRVIGKALRKIDAVSKVTGATKFADDLAFPRMLYCKLLRSTQPHARIVSIDTSAASRLEGVQAVLIGKDLPIPFGILPVSQDEHALCADKVRFIGDPVAAVAATSEETATAALDLIKVEYEPLKSFASAEEAVEHPEPRIHDYGDVGNLHKLIDLEFGDADAGIAEGDLVREDLFFFEGNTHLPMEQHAAVATWSPDGKVTLWSSTQTPHYVHRALAKVLELPPARIRVIATPNGGGFGGKSDPFSHEICVAKLSMITRRPVKITLTREESFYVHRGRHPVKMFAKTGVKSDGTIQAMQYKTFLDGGGYSSYGLASVYYTGALQTVTYKVPAYKFEGVRVFTNKPACGPKRGHGTPQPRFAMEIQLDEIAEKLGIDPIELRLKQLVEPNSTTVNGLRVSSTGLRECIERVAERAEWQKKFGKLPFGHGVGFAASSYISGAGLPIYWNNMPHSGVQIKLDRSGGVAVFCGSIDIGQGSDSILAYAVAEEFGIDPADIRVLTADTDLGVKSLFQIAWPLTLDAFITTWVTLVVTSLLACLFIRFTASSPGLYPSRGFKGALLMYRVNRMNSVQRLWTWTITGQYLRALAGLRFPHVGASECDVMYNLVPEVATADTQVFWSNGSFTNMLDCGAEHFKLRRLDMPRNFFSGNNCVAEYGQFPSNFLLGVSSPGSEIQFRRQMRSRLGESITVAGNPPVKFSSASFEEEHESQGRPSFLLFLTRVLLNDLFSIGMLPVAEGLVFMMLYLSLLRLDMDSIVRRKPRRLNDRPGDMISKT